MHVQPYTRSEVSTDATYQMPVYTEFEASLAPPVGTPDHALWVVHWHFEWENPAQVEQLRILYTDDIVWELPTAGQVLHGKDAVIDNYRLTFSLLPELEFEPIETFVSAEGARVFDDRLARFVVEDVENFPMDLPVKSDEEVWMRLCHSFWIRDGLISRENAYQMLLPRKPEK
jgi:SnoaL-like domain